MWWRIPLYFSVILLFSYLLFNLIAYIVPDSPTATEVLLLLLTIQMSFIISIQIYLIRKGKK